MDGITLLAAPRSIRLKGAPGDPPYCFTEISIDEDICMCEEAPKKFLVTRRVCGQLGERRSGGHRIRAPITGENRGRRLFSRMPQKCWFQSKSSALSWGPVLFDRAPPLSAQIEETVLSAKPDGHPKQIRKMFRGEHGGLRPVGEDLSLTQKNHAFDLRNNFGHVVCHEQNPEPRLR
jgi:hypothetical protein